MELKLIETNTSVALTMSVEALFCVVVVLLFLLGCRMAAGPDGPEPMTEGCRCERVPCFYYREYSGTRPVCEQGGKVCPWAKLPPRKRAASRD
jgi:hypothetical protein